MEGFSTGHLITIVATMISMGGMSIGFIWAIKANTMVLDTRFTERSTAIAERLSGVQEELKKLNTVVTDMAVQNQRMTAIEERISNQAKRLDMLDQRFEELRHGEGFVFPLEAKLRS